MSFTSYTLLAYPGIEQSIYQSIHRFVFGSVFRSEDASDRNLEIKFPARKMDIKKAFAVMK